MTDNPVDPVDPSADDVVDDSQSTEPLDESTLAPLSESAGVLADDPDADHPDDHSEYATEDPDDPLERDPEEEPAVPLPPPGPLSPFIGVG